MKLLTTGTLHQDPVTLTAKNGNEYTKGILKEVKGDVTNWINLTAFDSNGVTLASLNAGDSLSVSGEATVALYTPDGKQPRVSTSVTVEQIITLKRQKPVARTDANTGKPPTVETDSARVSTSEAVSKKQYISDETLKAAKESRSKKNAPIPTGTCPTCNHTFDSAGKCDCQF